MSTLLRAEWTKFRTVPGWVLALVAGAAIIVGLGLGPSMSGSCGKQGPGSECNLPTGPDGERVSDSFYFVHQPMTGDGTVTVRVASFTGTLPSVPKSRDDDPAPHPGLAPWAKAGLMVKDGTGQGATYAAMMVTGAHGIRMQWDFTHDVAGPAGTTGWLRLTRAGDTISGYASADGTQWTEVGTARLAGLPATAQVGLFATSPQWTESVGGMLAGAGAWGGLTTATASFDHVTVPGSSAQWKGDRLGGAGNETPEQGGGYQATGDGFTVTGAGDIAPAITGAAGLGTTITQTLVGTFIGLIFVVVIGTMFMTAEYRRGLIRTTMAAHPRRGRVLAAKAAVLGATVFPLGLAAAVLVVLVGQRVLRANGVYVLPVGGATEARVIVGTGALLAVAAVLALGIGTVLRRSVLAVTAVIVTVVLPYLLAISVLPVDLGRWLLRVTPAAGFAIQQSAAQYHQVDSTYAPNDGYFPLSPWAGFGVLCLWTVAALALGGFLLRRRDA
jgi:ABC-2 family transporter protein